MNKKEIRSRLTKIDSKLLRTQHVIRQLISDFDKEDNLLKESLVKEKVKKK